MRLLRHVLVLHIFEHLTRQCCWNQVPTPEKTHSDVLEPEAVDLALGFFRLGVMVRVTESNPYHSRTRTVSHQ